MGSIQHAEEYWTLGLQFIDSGNYISVNRSLIAVLGLHEAVIIGELASEAMLYSKKEKLKSGWFYITAEKLENKTGLSAHLQRKAMNNLKEAGVIEIAYKGLPKKRYVRINFQQLMNLVNLNTSTDLTTVDEQRLPLYVDDFNDINNHKRETTQQKPSTHIANFKKPTLEEVTAYCQQRKNDVDPQFFIDYQETRGWKLKGGTPMKDWKAAIRTWERNAKTFRNQKSQRSLNSRELDERMKRDFGNTVVTTIDNRVQVNNGEDEEECPF